ncbi:MAG TPA: endopeptidase La [Candidatus Sumerlaeota bacterium]|nr:endopeptidase La [Candidatus Sumerlaeota bacterium]HON50237.1 endopeptidase La [Candidatus Sumerlaeota bacterium]HOR63453.1 endopeptidase La [Candidatus Sumerlaeota bacterium]HPL74204.1 endopeptidase La [Candidatus Sumerlaeota bacterium]HRU54697.1 endopeptidase La [Candidatus Sumerlaeia bacterium]
MTEESNISIDDMTKIFKGEDIEIPNELPILDFDNFVLFPFMIAPLVVSNSTHKTLISEAVLGNRFVGVFFRQPKSDTFPETTREEKGSEDKTDAKLAYVGCAAMILRMLKIPDGSMRIILHGINRIKIHEVTQTSPYLKARIIQFRDYQTEGITVDAMMHETQKLLQRAISLSNLPEELGVAAMNISEPGKLSDLVATNLNLSLTERQKILNIIPSQDRLEYVMGILAREVEVMELGDKIRTKVKGEVEKNQREFILREQLKAIQKELGEGSDGRDDIVEFRQRIEKKAMPENVLAVVNKEMKRLEMMPQSSPEYTVSRSYIETILELPWMESTEDSIDIRKAAEILDEDHYDLDKIKERILEYLAVVKLRKSIKGPILCFVGPPGVGKTSLGKSVARALGRKFFHFSLGGMRDEAEIRGHRRTYIGSMPGRIINGLKVCAANNPVMMLDEVDKIGADFRGDPASALLEVLDPEQNYHFTDHYLDLPFDLSKVMFITTANILDTIPPALQDRMEVLRLPGYTLNEKKKIARRYLIPKEYEANGVTSKNVTFTDAALETIIEKYTREAGLRNLQREIGSICRKVARKVAEGESKKIQIIVKNVALFLGPPIYIPEFAKRPLQPGVAIGLAWTQTGGEILFIESSLTHGKGKLILTGQLGDVMKESAQAALTWIHSVAPRFKIKETMFSSYDIHVHVPAGAIPKDGPSAGISICSSLASLFMSKKTCAGIAMTGEITLKGNVLPVGGIKEKVLAAHRAGVREVIIPADNEKDLAEIPAEIKKSIKFRFARKMDDVLKWAIEKPCS